jgi:predicted dehydrogenase
VSEQPVRLALVGCGYWGPKVARAAASVPGVTVAALVDRQEDLARRLQVAHPAALVATSLDQVLDSVDAVVVATNPATHTEVAGEAIAAGKHVLVEKPLALSSADCRSLGQQADAAGVVLMAGHTFLFSPAVQLIHGMITAGDLGEIYYVDSQRLNLGKVRQDVDAIWNFAPHDVSITNHWMGGAPATVACHAYEYLQEGIADVATMNLEYGGVAALIQISWLSPSKVRRMTVVGSEKMVVYDDVADTVLVHDAGIDRQRVDRSFADFNSFAEFRLIHRLGDVHMPRLAGTEPLVAQCSHFAECIRTGARPVAGAQEAIEVVSVLEAATASHQAGGARVDLPGSSRPALTQ